MTRAGPTLAAAFALLASAGSAADDSLCRDCLERSSVRPLDIVVESGLQFSRLALRGKAEGSARIDPQTGDKQLDANMIDLGGQSWQGRARVTGEPLRPVRIELPPQVRLRSPDGAQAELTDFVTDLPTVAVLDENGTLTFNFGARLSTRGARGGNFRGRIAIRVDYF